MNDLTKTDDANLADIIWFIHGWISAHKLLGDDSFSLHNDHIKSLKKFREAYHRYLEGKAEI